MPTLLLRLAGPLQSWGSDSRFEVRETSREPTKSAVIGLAASAMGYSRDDPLDDLRMLRFGIRVDQPGVRVTDFHTAHNDLKNRAYVTTRAYLADAVFLAGLQGDERLLEDMEDALANPHHPLFLGRRSCPPAGKLVIGIRQGDLIQSLKEEPWQASGWYMRRQPEFVSLEVVVDSDGGSSAEYQKDDPISFSQEERMFGFRGVERSLDAVSVSNPFARIKEKSTEHDVFSQLGRD